jgi:hypothetical protein
MQQSIRLVRGQSITLTANPRPSSSMVLSDVALHNRKMGVFDPRRLYVTNLVA